LKKVRNGNPKQKQKSKWKKKKKKETCRVKKKHEKKRKKQGKLLESPTKCIKELLVYLVSFFISF
jgi:hypothetical protein